MQNWPNFWRCSFQQSAEMSKTNLELSVGQFDVVHSVTALGPVLTAPLVFLLLELHSCIVVWFSSRFFSTAKDASVSVEQTVTRWSAAAVCSEAQSRIKWNWGGGDCGLSVWTRLWCKFFRFTLTAAYGWYTVRPPQISRESRVLDRHCALESSQLVRANGFDVHMRNMWRTLENATGHMRFVCNVSADVYLRNDLRWTSSQTLFQR